MPETVQIHWVWRWALTDLRDFKGTMYKLIDSVHEVEHARFGIDADQYSRSLYKVSRVDPKGARKLVDCFDDIVLTRFAERLRSWLWVLTKLSLLAAFVVFVVFIYNVVAS